MEPQKTPRSQSNLEKENQNWWHHVAWFQAILESWDHQDSMVVAQKQAHTSMEQNREPRNGPSTLWSTDLQQSRKEYPKKKQSRKHRISKKRQSLQQMVLGKLDSHMQKNETGPFSYTIHKDKLKMDERSKCEVGIH